MKLLQRKWCLHSPFNAFSRTQLVTDELDCTGSFAPSDALQCMTTRNSLSYIHPFLQSTHHTAGPMRNRTPNITQILSAHWAPTTVPRQQPALTCFCIIPKHCVSANRIYHHKYKTQELALSAQEKKSAAPLLSLTSTHFSPPFSILQRSTCPTHSPKYLISFYPDTILKHVVKRRNAPHHSLLLSR